VYKLEINSQQALALIDITDMVKRVISESGVGEGQVPGGVRCGYRVTG